VNVGVLGGGQLGVMLAESLHSLGAHVRVYAGSLDCPAGKRLPDVTIAAFDDVQALLAFFQSCDSVTYESENIPAGPLLALPEAEQAKLKPGIHVLQVVQDRVEEKQFCARVGLPTVAYRALEHIEELPGAAADIGFPFILKSATGGYDGKGQYRVNGLRDLGELAPLRLRAEGRWVVEEVVDLVKEVSCIVARQRTADGDRIQVFPPFENDHRNHALDVTLMPAQVTESQARVMTGLAIEAARQLDVDGLLTTEFFLARSPGAGGVGEVDGLHIRVNEFAPRTHNSGHVTRRSCSVSQFDQLARLLVGLAPGLPVPFDGGFAMVQLLGEVWEAQGRTGPLDLSALVDHSAVLEVNQYGKSEVRRDRKMGHVISTGPTALAAKAAGVAFRGALMRSGGE